MRERAEEVAARAREAAGEFAKHWKEFWRPFSTVPDGDKILARRYEAMGRIGTAPENCPGTALAPAA